ncbi:MAG: hypothetical protein JO165_09510, partial [Candidatus Eremiobacteraeota bacterium]|nr:hypothetical protein [Candidatus Eremiobacteraeota bacterium]
ESALRHVSRIELEPIAEAPMRLFVGELLGEQREAERESAILSMAGGNPYVAEQLANAATAGEIPRSLRAAVERRLRSFSFDELRALRALAVFPTEAGLDLLAAVLGVTAYEAACALERAQCDGLVLETGPSQFMFHHVLTREIVARSLTVAERMRYHERAALFLEACVERGENRFLGEIAYHFARSHLQVKAQPYAMRAAESAYAVHAYADAARYFEEAASFSLDGLEHRARAMRRAGDAYFRAGEASRARTAYREALRLYALMDASEDSADLYLSLMRSTYNAGDTEESIALGQEALERIPELSPQRTSEVRVNVAFALTNSGKPDEAIAELRAIHPSDVENNVEVAMIYHSALSGSLAALGRMREWRKQIQQWAEVSEQVSAARGIGSYGGIATDAMFLGERALARKFFNMTLRLARTLKLDAYVDTFCAHAAYACALHGDAQGARMYVSRLRSSTVRFPALLAFRLAAQFALGDEEDVEPALAEQILQTGQPAIFGPFAGWYARRLFMNGKATLAKELVGRAIAQMHHPYGAFDLVVTAAEFGDRELADHVRSEMEPFADSESHAHAGVWALTTALYERRFGKAQAGDKLAYAAKGHFAAIHWPFYVDLTSDPSPAKSYLALTEREAETAGLLQQGLTNREIAHRLHLSEKTVEKYLGSLFAKLSVSNRSQAATKLAGLPKE